MKKMVKKSKIKRFFSFVKDFIIYGIVIFAIISFIVYSFKTTSISEFKDLVLSLVADFTILILGVVGVFEFCYDNNITFLVPDSFINRKEKKQLELIEDILHEYLSNEEKTYNELQMDRTAFVLNQLGLSKDEFNRISLDIVKARLKPTTSEIKSLQDKLEDIIFSNDIIFDLENTASYSPGLRFYVKFHDLMHNKLLAEQLCNIMAGLIYNNLKEKMNDVSAIVVPHSSNYLLGLGTAGILGKNFIKVIPPEKAIANYNWEGNLGNAHGKHHVIIVHDVLLTSKQVIESIERLPDNCVVDGIFCLLYRKGHNGKEKLKQLGYDVYSLLEYTEDDLSYKLGLQ